VVEANIDDIIVEENYSGPKFEKGKLDLEFVLNLMEYLKDQKSLHKKYCWMLIKAC